MMKINFPITTLIELFSWKVLTRSVAISIPRISTALLSSPCFLTNSSLAKMAAALPSDVGLKVNVQINQCNIVTCRIRSTACSVLSSLQFDDPQRGLIHQLKINMFIILGKLWHSKIEITSVLSLVHFFFDMISVLIISYLRQIHR